MFLTFLRRTLAVDIGVAPSLSCWGRRTLAVYVGVAPSLLILVLHPRCLVGVAPSLFMLALHPRCLVGVAPSLACWCCSLAVLLVLHLSVLHPLCCCSIAVLLVLLPRCVAFAASATCLIMCGVGVFCLLAACGFSAHDACCGSTNRQPCNNALIACLGACSGGKSCYRDGIPISPELIKIGMELDPEDCCGTSC